MNNLCVGRSVGIIYLSERNNRRALVSTIFWTIAKNINPSSKTSVGSRAYGSILHKTGYNYGIGGVGKYYNPFYVTYRGKGSRQSTGAFCQSKILGFACGDFMERTLHSSNTCPKISCYSLGPTDMLFLLQDSEYGTQERVEMSCPFKME